MVAQTLDINKAQAGDKLHQFLFGVYYLNLNEFEQAFFWFHAAAQQDYPAAQYNLGYLYLTGQGTELDYQKGYEWYERAAEQEFENAQFICLRILEIPGVQIKVNTITSLTPQLLEKIRNNRIRKVAICYVELSDAEVTALCAALTNNNKLKELILNGCNIGDAGAVKIAHTLCKHHRKPDFCLSLTKNKIGDIGANALAHLKISKLDLRYNDICGASIKKLKKSGINECLVDPTYIEDADRENVRKSLVTIHRFFATAYQLPYDDDDLNDYETRREMTQLIPSKVNQQLIENESPTSSTLYQFNRVINFYDKTSQYNLLIDSRRLQSPPASAIPEFGQSALEENDKQKNILHSLIEFGKDDYDTIKAIQKALTQHQINIDERDDIGHTPLARAIRLGKLNIVQYLVISGCSLTSMDNKGRDLDYFISLIQDSKLSASVINIIEAATASRGLTEEQTRRFHFF